MLSNNGRLEDTWWEFLGTIDPDAIKSLVPLDDTTIERLDRYISPCVIEVPDPKYSSGPLRLACEGLDVRANIESIRAITRPHWGKSEMISFDISGVSDRETLRFISRNFGTTHALPFAGAPRGTTVKLTDRSSLAEAFRRLAEQTGVVHTFPSQLCSLPSYLPEPSGPRISSDFEVVIGDSPADGIYSWNRVLTRPAWSRPYVREIWLPKALAEDLAFMEPFAQWLQGFAVEQIEVRSCSLTKKELEELAHPLNVVSALPARVGTCKVPEKVSFSYSPIVRLESGMDLFRLIGNKEKLVLREPQPVISPLDKLGQKHWVADVYIQHLSPDLPSGSSLWWQLPRANFLVQSIFGTISRVGPGGFPSVLMNLGEPTLEVNIPDDEDPIISLLSRGRSPHAFFNDDPRMKFKHAPGLEVTRSDKGGYLKGFSGLFSGLYNAYAVLSERYWRKVFGLLAGVKKDASAAREATVNKLKKVISGGRGLAHFETDEGIQWLTEQVLQLAKGTHQGLELTLDDFIQLAKKELDDYNDLHKDSLGFDVAEVRWAVKRLLDMRVLELGLKSKCPACGQVNWYSIDEAGHAIECKGCTSSFSIAPDPKWFYRLNGLIGEGIAQHGLVPVMLVLGDTLQTSLTSFFYSTGLELKKPGTDRPFAEVDVAVINDGVFALGEVKQSVKLFSKDDFDKLEEVAIAVRPDVLFVSSLDPSPSKSVLKNLELLGKRLAPLGIRVFWVRLNSYIFEPSPVV